MNHKIGEQEKMVLADGKQHMIKYVDNDGHWKDLGILNEDGCLPEERTGKYPTIKDRNEYEGWRLLHIWDCTVCEKMGNDDEAIEIRVSALTRQEAIDRWNWRA